MLREGALVVLAGYPNSGKSSLFNALLGIERSIVTEIPGTTRDAIEASLTLQGFPFRLVDTAGLRQTDDPVEGLGIEFAHRYLRSADSIIYCVDATRALGEGDLRFLEAENRNVLLVRTKADLEATDRREATSGCRDQLRVSALTGQGLGELAERLVASNFESVRVRPGEMPLVTRERHARALRDASAELSLFLEATRNETPAEMAATHLRSAAVALEEIIGLLLPDDVLAVVFSQFCVGK
jgi:tRNA modification GTPase